MPRRSHDEQPDPSDEQARDITAQFWGTSPSWRTTGGVRRTRRGGERTGPVARTRVHGDRTGQVPVVPVEAVDEPLIDPYDFGLDDVGYGPDNAFGRGIDLPDRVTAGPRRDISGRQPAVGGIVHRPAPAEQVQHVDDVDEYVELDEIEIELEERRPRRPGDPVAHLVDRLGLGAVDPLLVRLGVIVMIGVMLVPMAMAMRPGSSGESVRTEVSAAALTDATGPGAATDAQSDPTAGATAPPADATAADTPATSVAPAPDDAEATESAATESTAVATTQPDRSAGASTGTLESADAALLDVAQSASGSAPLPAVDEAADVDEPATRVTPVCAMSYTVAAGDYWIRLADAADVALAELLAANLATIDTPLYPGDEICLPAGATMPAPPVPPSTAPGPTDGVTTTTTTAPTTTVPPAPTTTSSPAPAPPAPAQVDAIIREIWPDDLEERALEIAWRESGYRADAQNWCCYGLFQIYWNVHQSWLDDLGITSATQLLDARTNTRAAYALYQRSGGWGPWGG